MDSNRHGQTGFTLIEVLLALALAGIIASMTVSAYSSLNKRLAIRNLNNTLVNLLTQARLSAMTGGQNITICVVDDINANNASCQAWTTLQAGLADGARGWLIFADSNKNAGVDTGEAIISRLAFNDGGGKVGIISINGSGNAIRFSDQGLLISAGRTLVIGAGGKRKYDRKIIIAAITGRIRSQVVGQ